MDCFQLSFFRVEEAVSWTQRFLKSEIWPQNRSSYLKNKFDSKCLQKFYVTSKKENECYRNTTSYVEQPSRHFCGHFMRRTTQQNFLAINLASQQKTTKLYFFSQLKKQFNLFFLRFHLSHYAVVCEVINLWIAVFDLILHFRVIWSVNLNRTFLWFPINTSSLFTSISVKE